jgi:hypothetical protein
VGGQNPLGKVFNPKKKIWNEQLTKSDETVSPAARFYTLFSSHSRQSAMINLDFLEERKTPDDTFWDSNFPPDRTTCE